MFRQILKILATVALVLIAILVVVMGGVYTASVVTSATLAADILGILIYPALLASIVFALLAMWKTANRAPYIRGMVAAVLVALLLYLLQ